MESVDLASLTASEIEGLAEILEQWSEPPHSWTPRDWSALRASCPTLARALERTALGHGWGRFDGPFSVHHPLAQFFALVPEAPWGERDPSVPTKPGLKRLTIAWRACSAKYSHLLRLHREKLEAIRQLAYGASHEINNPLANISTRAQTLLIDEKNPERRNKLAAIVAQAFRAHEMIANLMLFARPPEIQVSEFEAKSWLTTLMPELEALTASQQTRLKVEASLQATTWRGDASQLSQLVTALVRNSCEALGSGGTIQVAISPLRPSEPDEHGLAWWSISVIDDGPGFSEAALQHAFDPFFSGREAGRGLGFGLSKCWVICQAHRGKIEIDEHEKKTRVAARLPIGLPAVQHSRSAMNDRQG